MPYAITTVPEDWSTQNPLGFSEAAYETWHRTIEPGTRVLIYKGAPVNAIIAEAVVPDNAFIKVANWPQKDISKTPRAYDGEAAEYVLPLRVLYSHPAEDYIPMETVSDATGGDDFKSRAWTPINHSVYDRLNTYPDPTR